MAPPQHVQPCSLLLDTTEQHMENHHHHLRELQLLPSTAAASSPDSPFMIRHRPRPSLDLQLSMRQDHHHHHHHNQNSNNDDECLQLQALKWQAAEQIRLAALEKEYAERVRELTRREMELAHSDFACARHVWETAREEVQRADRLKEIATRRIHDPSSSSMCNMEITCHSCRQRFRP